MAWPTSWIWNRAISGPAPDMSPLRWRHSSHPSSRGSALDLADVFAGRRADSSAFLPAALPNCWPSLMEINLSQAIEDKEEHCILGQIYLTIGGIDDIISPLRDTYNSNII